MAADCETSDVTVSLNAPTGRAGFHQEVVPAEVIRYMRFSKKWSCVQLHHNDDQTQKASTKNFKLSEINKNQRLPRKWDINLNLTFLKRTFVVNGLKHAERMCRCLNSGECRGLK